MGDMADWAMEQALMPESDEYNDIDYNDSTDYNEENMSLLGGQQNQQQEHPESPNIQSPDEGVQASYPHLFTPQMNMLKTPPEAEYSIIILLPPATLQTKGVARMLAGAEEALTKKWPTKRPPNLRSCFRRMEDHKSVVEQGVWPEGFVPGGYWMTLRSKFKPGVVDDQVQTIIDPSQVYGGVHVIVSMAFYAYSAGGNQGVSAGLRNVQVLTQDKRNKPFGGGRTAPESEFRKVGTPAPQGDAVSRLLG